VVPFASRPARQRQIVGYCPEREFAVNMNLNDHLAIIPPLRKGWARSELDPNARSSTPVPGAAHTGREVMKRRLPPYTVARKGPPSSRRYMQRIRGTPSQLGTRLPHVRTPLYPATPNTTWWTGTTSPPTSRNVDSLAIS